MGEKTYTEDEAMHLVAREVAKQRMSDMERKIADSETKNAISLAELKTQISQVITMIKEQSLAENESRGDLKEEIERDFASKIDLERLESKLDKLQTRITTAIAVAVFTGSLVGWLINTSLSAAKIITR